MTNNCVKVSRSLAYYLGHNEQLCQGHEVTVIIKVMTKNCVKVSRSLAYYLGHDEQLCQGHEVTVII